MIENLKYLLCLKSVDKDISAKNYDLALDKLNFLVKEGYKPAETFLKRGKLCHKLLMYEDAYSDFTYIITHCANKFEAFSERIILNYEMANFYEVLVDANKILGTQPDNFEIKRLKFLSYVFSSQEDIAKNYVSELFDYNKYKIIQFLIQEVNILTSRDELAKGLKLLKILDDVDKDNPVKLLKEAGIYERAGQISKKDEILKRIDSVFPKYFISHFRFTDMYQEKDLLEISFLLELKIFDKQNLFAFPMAVLEGYKKHSEGHITESKECFERAIEINPNKPEGYILLAQTLQLMSGYDNPDYMKDAEKNYTIAMDIYKKENLLNKAEEMKRQIKHITAGANIYSTQYL